MLDTFLITQVVAVSSGMKSERMIILIVKENWTEGKSDYYKTWISRELIPLDCEHKNASSRGLAPWDKRSLFSYIRQRNTRGRAPGGEYGWMPQSRRPEARPWGHARRNLRKAPSTNGARGTNRAPAAGGASGSSISPPGLSGWGLLGLSSLGFSVGRWWSSLSGTSTAGLSSLGGIGSAGFSVGLTGSFGLGGGVDSTGSG